MKHLSASAPRAILLDLDDTIMDFGGNVDEAWREACRFATESVDALDPVSLYDAICDVRDWFWADPERHAEWRQDLRAASAEIVRLAFASIGHEVDPQLARSTASHYRDMRDQSYRLFPGALRTLQHLRETGFLLALVTNGSAGAQRAKIERFDLERHFDHIQIEGEYGFGKPDPRAYATALRILDVAPAEAWFVGDNLEWDVFAPQRIGMRAAWVTQDGSALPTDAPARPDLVVSSISELPWACSAGP